MKVALNTIKQTDKCRQYQFQFAGTRVFGVPLSSLVSKDRKVPLIVERLIAIVELHGMYTEGLYRRAGAQAKVKLLKQLMDSGKEGWFFYIHLTNVYG